MAPGQQEERWARIVRATEALLDEFGRNATLDRDGSHTLPSADDDWERSGAAALTAPGAIPRGDVPAGLRAAASALAAVTHGRVTIDGPAQLSLRERLSAETHQPAAGQTLRGGGRMLATADGWLAMNLPRDSDHEMIAALTDAEVSGRDWDALAAWASHRRAAEVVDTAALLGLAISAVPRSIRGSRSLPWTFETSGVGPESAGQGPKGAGSPRVVDLTSLWAGPLAGALIAESGARVVKLESESRPELPLSSDAEFFARLNGRKERRRIDFADSTTLTETVGGADIVLVSARPRALSSLGLAPRPGQLWVHITAHGTQGADRARVGFGDDAAAAAGVVAELRGTPVFAGDALADPVTGVLAAVAALGYWDSGLRGRITMSLADCAAWAANVGATP